MLHFTKYSTLEQFQNYCIEIENLNINYPDSTKIIADYFNLPNILWVNSATHSLIEGLRNNKADTLQNLIVLLELFQFNFIKNQHGNILDLIFLNSHDIITTKNNFPLVKEDICHPPLQITDPNFNYNRTLKNQSIELHFSRKITMP